ncbi:hypothetical protein A33Q_3151 [Indibacter alkaliphilus LW1]|uniref:Uncharacterized protein n=1 Tax=Indibacter alkaliphilus (strain CCUG 57479 / KCTC 22604 / LW1) TaxID=1189612 RepID=S2DA39_INDAL|nr:hypothetical protein A33Q_3151 [Indibacter alkaliphilus LW1]
MYFNFISPRAYFTQYISTLFHYSIFHEVYFNFISPWAYFKIDKNR